MAEIALRFVQGTAWDSRIIEWQTRAWCSHVESFAYRNELSTIGALFKDGVRLRGVHDACYKGISREETVRLRCKDWQYEKFHEFLRAQLGKPYDWRAILSFAFGNRDWQEPDSWFCSELQAAALVYAGLLHITLPADRLTPRDLYLLVMNLPPTS